jgi:hypothetical protein
LSDIFREYGLTFFLFLIVLGIGYWTFTGYQSLDQSIRALQTPVPVIMPTALPPTPTPEPTLPPPPQGPQTLRLDESAATLHSEDGTPVFQLNESGQWVPVVPESISDSLPQESQPTQTDRGLWILMDGDGLVAYHWRENNWTWMEVAVEAGAEDVGIWDAYLVSIDGYSIKELLLKQDDELLKLAPQLTPADYGLEVNTLSPVEVLRIGESGKIPYLLYGDENDKIRIAWNIEKGEFEHVEQSVYYDALSDFTIRTFLVTDFSWRMNGNSWFKLDEAEEGGLSKAIFEYPLALNNMYTNHYDDFRVKYGLSNRDSDIWYSREVISQQKHSWIRSDALNLFRHDLVTIPEGELWKIKLRPAESIRLNNNSLLIILRIQFDKHYSLTLTTNGVFKFAQFFSVYNGTGYSELVIEMDQDPRIESLVGGVLVEVLREITAGGTYSYFNDAPRTSTTDKMVQELCGKNKFDLYMRLVNSEHQLIGAVPREDRYAVFPLLCLYEEQHVEVQTQ